MHLCLLLAYLSIFSITTVSEGVYISAAAALKLLMNFLFFNCDNLLNALINALLRLPFGRIFLYIFICLLLIRSGTCCVLKD